MLYPIHRAWRWLEEIPVFLLRPWEKTAANQLQHLLSTRSVGLKQVNVPAEHEAKAVCTEKARTCKHSHPKTKVDTEARGPRMEVEWRARASQSDGHRTPLATFLRRRHMWAWSLQPGWFLERLPVPRPGPRHHELKVQRFGDPSDRVFPK